MLESATAYVVGMTARNALRGGRDQRRIVALVAKRLAERDNPTISFVFYRLMLAFVSYVKC